MVDTEHIIDKAVTTEKIADIITGKILRTAASGSRIVMNADSLIAYDDANNEIFKIVLTGPDTGDIIVGDYANNKGLKWDKSEDTFDIRGSLTADDIVGGVLSQTAIVIENRTDDEGCTQTGRLWLRTDV